MKVIKKQCPAAYACRFPEEGIVSLEMAFFGFEHCLRYSLTKGNYISVMRMSSRDGDQGLQVYPGDWIVIDDGLKVYPPEEFEQHYDVMEGAS